MRRFWRWTWVRQLLLVAALAATWAAWVVLPPSPLAEWRIATIPVQSAQLSPDGTRLIGGADMPWSDGDLPGWNWHSRLWDATSGKDLTPCRLKYPEFLPGGWIFGLGSGAEGATLRSADDGRVVWTYPQGTFGMNVSGDGNALACASREPVAAVRLVDLPTGRVTRTFSEVGWQTALNADGKILATTTADEFDAPIRVWNVDTGREIARTEGKIGRNSILAMSPDGQLLATTRFGSIFYKSAGVVTIWELSKGRRLAGLNCRIDDQSGLGDSTADINGRIPGHPDILQFSPNGRMLVIRRRGRELLWDLSTDPPRCRDDLLAGTEDSAAKARGSAGELPNAATPNAKPLIADRFPMFIPDGSKFVVPGVGRPQPFWRVYDGSTLALVSECVLPNGTVDSAGPAVSPDGRLLAQIVKGAQDLHLVCLFDLATGAIIGQMPGNAHLVGFAPDSRSVWTYTSADRANGDWFLNIRRIPVPSWRPPPWLLAATVVGVLLLIFDFVHGRMSKGKLVKNDGSDSQPGLPGLPGAAGNRPAVHGG